MILLHYKSGDVKTKLFIWFLFFGVFAGATITIVGLWTKETIIWYGSSIEGLFVSSFILEWLLAKTVIKNLTTLDKGIKSKNKKEFYFMNIDFKRELFTHKHFQEYYEYYYIFYKNIKRTKW